MFEDVEGKSVLVTGASRGLGRHFAERLGTYGAHVFLGARDVDTVTGIADGIREAGGTATAIRLDVTANASLDAAMASIRGGPDILINNAGISKAESAIDVAETDWDRVIDTNLKGVFLAAQTAARAMRANGTGGAIVNIASILGLRVAGGDAAYAVSKAGVVQLTKVLALEWARYGIRVNALCPGYFETDLNRAFLASEAGEALIRRIPQRRVGTPHELDGPLLLLCSDAGSYITGATLAVDGGHLVSTL